jgi:hypothetical protein
MVFPGACVADWVDMDAQNPDEWLTTAATAALGAIADIHAAGEDELTQVCEQTVKNRACGSDAGSDADLEDLHRAVVRARRARAQAHDPN